MRDSSVFLMNMLREHFMMQEAWSDNYQAYVSANLNKT